MAQFEVFVTESPKEKTFGVTLELKRCATFDEAKDFADALADFMIEEGWSRSQ